MENLIGFILPPIIDLINKRVPKSNLRYIISLLVCLIIAAVLNVKELQFGNSESFLVSFGLIFGEAQTVYKLYWSESKARTNLNLK